MASAPASADTLTVVGTGDGLDMLRSVAAAYAQQNPGRVVDLPASIGSGGGIAAVSSGREKMGRVARSLSSAEIQQGLSILPVARIPSAFIVNRSVSVENLSYEQLRKIFDGTITNWKDVGGQDLRIRVVRREEGDSTLQTLRANMPGWQNLAFTVMSKQAVTTQDMIETITKVDGAIGFGPFSGGLEPGVRVLNIEKQWPTAPNYPSSVVLSLIYKSSATDDDVRAFLAFVRSSAARSVIQSFGAVPVDN